MEQNKAHTKEREKQKHYFMDKLTVIDIKTRIKNPEIYRVLKTMTPTVYVGR